MVTRIFESQIGRNVEAYIDDMVIKSKQVGEHLADLGEVFSVLWEHRLRLNASKCSFRVSSGKLLGYMITHRGIEVNPDKIKAINSLHLPQNHKEMQKLTGMTATLNRFIAQSANRCHPFFQLFHKWKDFQWTKECVLAFEELKQYLSCPLILSRPEKEEVLYAYLAITDYAVSLVLVRNKNGVQRPIYYVSKSLHEAKTHYLPLEKVVLAIVRATRRLPHYFQAHTMVVLTQLPLQALLRKSYYTGKITKWGTMLGAYDVRYMPCIAIKGQALADFVAKFAKSIVDDGKKIIETMMVSISVVVTWEVYTDGAANRKGLRVGVVLITPKKLVIKKSLCLGFLATNNEVEYEALLVGMAMFSKLGREAIEVYSDSRLVVGQANGEFKAKDEHI